MQSLRAGGCRNRPPPACFFFCFLGLPLSLSLSLPLLLPCKWGGGANVCRE
jgi:hypothetical protein